MTGFEVYRRARLLMGDTEGIDSSCPELLDERSLCAVNQIGQDLCGMPAAKSVFDELDITPAAENAMPYGVAMMLSIMSGDGERNRFFCDIYNARRAVAKASSGRIRDTLPGTGVLS